MTGLLCLLVGCSGKTSLSVQTSDIGGNAGTGGAIRTGGTAVRGGSGGSGGVIVTGGVTVIGGTMARGGVQGTGGIPTGGTGGFVCTNVSPCGGDVVGTWGVTSTCLNVLGQLDLSMLGLGCKYGSVVGSLKVNGTWTAKADGTYVDRTTTSGTEQITLPASCLTISGTTVACEPVGSIVQALGYDTVSCTSATGGGCSCTATVLQSGGIGILSMDPQASGKYTASGSVITTDSTDPVSKYSYCVSSNTMSWSPQSTSAPTMGTIIFQRGTSTGSGGANAAGGAGGTGGNAGVGGATMSAPGPCDIYAADRSPCVAAHSTVRRLLSTYTGPLYQVRVGGLKSGDVGTPVDIGFLEHGFADGAAQDLACGTSTCPISIIYDQSGFGNHLTYAPSGGAKRTADKEADAKALSITIGGHKVYGVHLPAGTGYRNNQIKGTALGDDPETIYMVASGDYYNGGCCFDYGNAETNNMDNGEGAVEAVYFGNCTIWSKGADNGPWVMADLENGLWAGNTSPYDANTSVPSSWKYVTGMVKGDSTGKNHWTIKEGNAQSGRLTTSFDGPRPSTRYNPMRKEGAIVLGIGGDNSNAGQGNFFEGVMTAHYASDAADDAVQANIVAAYGR
jgi:hypothetical protein